MAELSCAFLALPGGLGTLEEAFEAVSWTQLRLQGKPTRPLNLKGSSGRRWSGGWPHSSPGPPQVDRLRSQRQLTHVLKCDRARSHCPSLGNSRQAAPMQPSRRNVRPDAIAKPSTSNVPKHAAIAAIAAARH
jgi:hypothetical protein